MHVFQRGALARRRIVRFALTSATVLVLAGLAVLVAGVVSSDGGPVLPAFVGPLQRVLAFSPTRNGEGGGTTPSDLGPDREAHHHVVSAHHGRSRELAAGSFS